MKILLTLFMFTASISLKAQEVLFKLQTVAIAEGSLDKDNHPVIGTRNPLKVDISFQNDFIQVADGKQFSYKVKNKEVHSIDNSVMVRHDGIDNHNEPCVVMLEVYEDVSWLSIYYPENHYMIRFYIMSDDQIKALSKGKK